MSEGIDGLVVTAETLVLNVHGIEYLFPTRLSGLNEEELKAKGSLYDAAITAVNSNGFSPEEKVDITGKLLESKKSYDRELELREMQKWCWWYCPSVGPS